MTIDRAIEILDPEHREHYDGMDEVNEACRMGMEALERMRWTPCSEKLPDAFVSVLVEIPGEEPFPIVREGYISDDGTWVAGNFKREPGEITRWRPMPAPPKGGDGE